jgi:uncharacterized protein
VAASHRILSLDGGGIHGLLTTRLLQQIEEQTPGFLEQANIFAGTSAGGIIALVLASSQPQNRGARLDDCARLFGDPDLIQNKPIGYMQAVAGAGPVYSEEPWRTEVRKLLDTGCMTLGELPAKVVIPAFELDNGEHHPNWRPRIFHNFHAQNPGHAEWFEHGGGDQVAVDVALRSSAGPVVTPVYQGYVDGGVFANNPSLCAISVVLHDLEQPDPDRRILDDITMVSVGSGKKRAYLLADQRRSDHWGWFKWLLDPKHPFALLDMMFDSGSEIIDFQARHLLGRKHYVRVDPPLRKRLHRVDFPSLEAINMLERTANSPHANTAIAEARNWLNGDCGWFNRDRAREAAP